MDEPYDDTPVARPAHRNPPAEQAVLGALLIAGELADQLAPELDPADFYEPRHETIWRAIHAVTAAGIRPDPVTVTNRLLEDGDLTKVGGPLYLHELTEACPVPASAASYAAAVRQAARLRAIDHAATRLRSIATTADVDDLEQALNRAYETLDTAAARFGATSHVRVHVSNLKEFLTSHDDDHDWIIPDLLERQDRVILTGGEGAGKSTLGRQIAMQAAAGLHPFTNHEIKPLRVLIIDFENSERQLRREFGKLYPKVRDRLDPDQVFIFSRLAGVNLLDETDRSWMRSVVSAVKPDLLVTGPAYKMTDGDTDKEKESKPVALFLDELRADHDCAIWLEAHVGNEQPGSRNRPERPFGWSGWRRWPEFGLYLAGDGELKHWRGDRDQRRWPSVLKRGGDWPFTTDSDITEDRWIRIRNARENAGYYLTYTNLKELTELTQKVLQNIIGPNGRYYREWQQINGTAPFQTNGREVEL